MIKIKTASEIKNDLVSFYSKIQDKVTDFSPVSIIGGLLYAFGVEGEKLYIEMAEVEKQAFVATAEGDYLDRHIDGTYGLKRNEQTAAHGYVIVYANSPIQNPGNVKLRCAYYDSAGVLQDVDTAAKFVTSGNDSYAGRVFVLMEPANKTASSSYTDESGKTARVINLGNNHPRFIVLPVTSLLTGIDNNVPEGAINQFPTRPAGIDGVLNTYNPQSVFYSTPDSYNVPFSIRFTDATSLRNTSSGETVIDVTIAYYFTQQGGLLGFEDRKGNRIRGRYYKRTTAEPYFDFTTPAIEKDLAIDYKEAQSGTISLVKPLGVATDYNSSIEELPSIRVKNELGNFEDWVMLELVYKDVITPVYSIPNVLPSQVLVNYLNSKIDDPSKLGLIVRQLKADIDEEFVFDPDGVMGADGIIVESARIGGAIDVEEDDAYRQKLRKYLASLSKATDAAIEAGALQVSGVSYAKVIRNSYTPRGSTLLLISSANGVVDKGTFFRTKRVLEREWKASGINLIIKTPQQVEITVLITVTLKPNFESSKDSIDEIIQNTVYDYFLSKNPGESLSYSELLAKLAGTAGVRNIWKMFFGKKLTTEVYKHSKASATIDGIIQGAVDIIKMKYTGYDYNLLKYSLHNKDFKDREVVLTEGQYEDVYIYADTNTDRSTVYIVKNASGVPTSYTPQPSDNYKRVIVTPLPDGNSVVEIVNDATWLAFSDSVKRITSASEFIDFVVSRKNEIFSAYADDIYKINYLVTQFCSEMSFINYEDTSEYDVPVNVDNIELKLLKEVELNTFEVPTLSSVIHDSDTIRFLGVEYV